MKKHLFFILLFSLISVTSFSQNTLMKGVVYSADDKSPIPGVSVLLKGTTTGVATDFDGKFSINANIGSTLVFSFVGYDKQEVEISDAAPLSIYLKVTSQDIDELVVIGYGTVKKSDLTGSVSSVSSLSIKQSHSTGLEQALQGRASGVTVISNSGQPGSGVTVRIRGIGTVNDSNPLYVVDGVALSDISFLNPSDIKALEVLKDASATAIYGARGANGVIMITTLQGTKSTKANTTFEFYTGVQSKWRTLDLMNRKQYAAFRGYDPADPAYTSFSDWVYKKFNLASNPYIPTDINYENYDTDWQNVVFRDNAKVNNYHFSVNGGNESSNYALSLGYLDQDGILISSNYKRLTFRLNTSYKLNDIIKVGENLSYMNTSGRGVATNNENYSILNSAISYAPWDPVKYPDGRIAPSTINNLVSPISMIENQNPTNEWNRIVGNFYVDLTPIKGLTFKSDFGTDITFGESKNFKPKYYISSSDYMSSNYIEQSYQKYFMWQWENTLTYNRKFGKAHDLTVMGGISARDTKWHNLGGSGKEIPNESSNLWYLGNTTAEYTVGGSAYDWSMLSYLGRIQYSLLNRYLFTFNIRRDGSSRFGINNKWGVFPSLSFGWKVSEEKFFEPYKDYINSLKFRAGWGRIGNSEIGNYDFTTTINSGITFVGYVFGQTPAIDPGAAPLTIANDDLKWETTEQTNFGIDFSALNNKLTASVDYFVKWTVDMLVPTPVPAHAGVRYYPTTNSGDIRNRGFEVNADYKQDFNDISFSVGGNFSIINNSITSISGGSSLVSTFKGSTIALPMEGYPIGAFYGYKTNGIFQDKYDVEEYVNSDGKIIQELAKPGDYRFVDKNDDGKIDADDRFYLGSPLPKFSYGFNLAAYYKNFDFQMFFQGVYGNKIFNCNKYFIEGTGLNSNLDAEMVNAWDGAGTSNTLANPSGSDSNLWMSDKFIENGSYLRLKNIKLGYTIPSNLSKRAGISKLYLYVSATNLLTFTKYSGYDPEIGISSGRDLGVDRGNYPQPRTILMGLSISL